MKRITTLIPAYKTEYLNDLFFGLKNQTYRNFNVIVSDDSPGGRVTELLQTPPFTSMMAGLDVIVIQGPRRGGFRNFLHLLNLPSGHGDLLHLMCDDDIIYPKFYEYHAALYHTPDLACSVSRRWTADVSGRPSGMMPGPAFVDQNMARALLLDAEPLFKSVVPHCDNWLGEHSNSVFSRQALPILLEPVMGDMSYEGLRDIGFFLKASLTKKVAFLQEYLGCFRTSPDQQTSQQASPARKLSYIAWCALAIAGVQVNKLSRQEAYLTFVKVDGMIRGAYPQDEEMLKFIALFSRHTRLDDALMQSFAHLWKEFLQTHPG